jgi:hypothetical protein
MAYQPKAVYEHVVCKAVDALLAAGFSLAGFDGEAYPFEHERDPEIIKANCFHTDDLRLECHSGEGKAWRLGDGWVQFYFENGAECLSDYTVNLEGVLAPVNAFAETLA